MFSRQKNLPLKLLEKLALFLLLTLAVCLLVWWRWDAARKVPEPNISRQQKQSNQGQNFDKTKYSNNNPASLWVIVNKGRVLPADYEPSGLTAPNVRSYYGSAANDSKLRSDAAAALEKMFAEAKTAGYTLVLYSGYRSYGEQSSVYANEVKTVGQAQADRESARAGHSEHQTGLAADISAANGKCDLQQCFDATPEGRWLAANGYKYGFILRYGKTNENLTGYEYEPWHFRYVGTDLAAEINKTGQTLEQFFNLPIYTAYPATSYQLKSGL